jgi:NAD+ kinase
MAKTFHFFASESPDAQAGLAIMRQRYRDVGPDDCDVIVALGGDGFMLQTLHAFLDKDKPIYGMNLGSVGFLMNEFHEENLQERLEAAESARIHPLKMRAKT